MVDYQFSKAWGRLEKYLVERKDYLFNNFDPKSLEIFVEFAVVYLLEYNGKFTIMSPIFTAYGPILVGINLISIQSFSNIYYHHWWAHGNIFLILMQIIGIF